MDLREPDNTNDKYTDTVVKLPTRDIELFQGLPAVQQARLLGSMEKMDFHPGALVFDYGDEGDSMYIVLEGNIELYTLSEDEGKHSLAVLGSGETFGEMSLLTGEPRSASAMALNQVALYQIDSETFAQMTAENSAIAHYFMRLLSHRLTQTNERLKKAQEDNLQLVLEDLQKLPLSMRQIILAASLLPDWPETFLTTYFQAGELAQQTGQYVDSCRHILRWNQDEKGLYINPACRSVLTEIYTREAPDEKAQLLSSAVEYYLASNQLAFAVQVYTDNGRWQEACELLMRFTGRISGEEELQAQITDLLGNCPDEILLANYPAFLWFLDQCITLRPQIGWNRLQIALANWRYRFSEEQVIALYQRAAEFCKSLGEGQKALEYLNLALSLAPTLEVPAGRLSRGGIKAPDQDRAYQLAKQQLNSAWRIASAERTSRIFAGKRSMAGWITGLLVLGCMGYFTWATPLAGLSRAGMLFAGISLSAVILWIVNLVPNYIVALVMAMAWVVSGLVGTEEALSGFSSPVWLYLLCILALGAAIAKSGLLYRLSLYALRIFPSNYRGQMLGLMVSGLLVNPLIPSATAKVALASPLAQGIARAMKFADRSKGSAGLGLAAMIFYGYAAPFTLTGTYTNLLGLGLIPGGSDISWLKWFVYALPALLVFTVGMLLSITLLFKPEKTGRPLSPETLDEQLAILGHLTREEKITITVALGSILLLILQPLHHVESTWVMLTGFSVLVLGGVLDTNSLKKGIDWPFLLFIGVAFSFTAVASRLGVVHAMTSVLAGYLSPFMSSPYLFILAVALASFVVTLVIRDDPAVILLVVSLLPLAQQAGIHPWILVFIILLTSDPFFFSYQSPTYLTAYLSAEGKAFSHKQGQKVALCYGLVVIIALLLSIPFWRYCGLIG